MGMSPEWPQAMRPRTAARYLDVSVRTVYNLLRAGARALPLDALTDPAVVELSDLTLVMPRICSIQAAVVARRRP